MNTYRYWWNKCPKERAPQDCRHAANSWVARCKIQASINHNVHCQSLFDTLREKVAYYEKNLPTGTYDYGGMCEGFKARLGTFVWQCTGERINKYKETWPGPTHPGYDTLWQWNTEVRDFYELRCGRLPFAPVPLSPEMMAPIYQRECREDQLRMPPNACEKLLGPGPRWIF